MACDICGKRGTALIDLLDSYKTPEINAVCPECEAALNRQLSKLRSVTHNILREWLRRFMHERKIGADHAEG